MAPESDARTCPKCNAQLDEGVQFCLECGTPLNVCTQCGKKVVEAGEHCAWCGKAHGHQGLDIPTLSLQPESCRALSPHAYEPVVLKEFYPYCPRTGKAIHLYLDICARRDFMLDVQSKVPARLRIAADRRVEITSLSARLGKLRLDTAGTVDILSRALVPRKQGHVFNWLLWPNDIPAGAHFIELQVEYACDGMRYTLTAEKEIHVQVADQGAIQFVNEQGHKYQGAEGGVFSGGAGNELHQHIDFGQLAEGGPKARFIREQMAQDAPTYVPLRARLRERGPVPPPPPPPPKLPSPPDWSATDRARVHLTVNGVHHNYCLLSATSLNVGRKQDWADIRLYDLEEYTASKAAPQAPGQNVQGYSKVCRKQGRIEVSGSGLAVTQLAPHNRCAQWVGPSGKPLKSGETVMLKPHKSVRIPGIIGLQYATNAPRFDACEQAMKTAREILAQGTPKPAPAAPFLGDFGGYRLARLHSLTGECFRGAEALQALEAYVLMPGWATIGASPAACIVVPEPHQDVNNIHAYVLFVDGYYFILPKDANSPTFVADEPVPPGMPWPLKPGSTIRLGTAEVKFGEFYQFGL